VASFLSALTCPFLRILSFSAHTCSFLHTLASYSITSVFSGLYSVDDTDFRNLLLQADHEGIVSISASKKRGGLFSHVRVL
jgi:hypothetical protein